MHGVIMARTWGGWCDVCLLPSASDLVCAVEINDSPQWLVTVTACEDCGTVQAPDGRRYTVGGG
jgi:hypothetical protein